MQRVRWSDNILSEGSTCIHGYFTREDIDLLFSFVPDGSLIHTFCDSRLSVVGRGINDLKDLDVLNWNDKYGKTKGFYFSFEEKKGEALLSFLKEKFPMVRGEGC